MKHSSKIISGKCRNRNCSYSLYVQPYAATREEFNKYSKKEDKAFREDNASRRDY